MRQFINNLPVSRRLGLLLVVMIAAMVAISTVGIRVMSGTVRLNHQIYTDNIEPKGLATDVLTLVGENRAQLLLALQHDPGSQFASLHDHPLDVHADNIQNNQQ